MAQTPSIPSIYREILNWLSDNNKMGLVDPYMSVGSFKLFNEGPYTQEWINQLQDLAEEALGRQLNSNETIQIQDYFKQKYEPSNWNQSVPSGDEIGDVSPENKIGQIPTGDEIGDAPQTEPGFVPEPEPETDLNTEGDLPLDETTIESDSTTTFNNIPAELSAQMERLYGTDPTATVTSEGKLDRWGNPAMNDTELEAWIQQYVPNFTMPENLKISYAGPLIENIRKNKWMIDETKYPYGASNDLYWLKTHRANDKIWEEANKNLPSWGSELPVDQRNTTNVLAPDGQVYRGTQDNNDKYLIYKDKNDEKIKAVKMFTKSNDNGHYDLAQAIKNGLVTPREDIENIYEGDRLYSAKDFPRLNSMVRTNDNPNILKFDESFVIDPERLARSIGSKVSQAPGYEPPTAILTPYDIQFAEHKKNMQTAIDNMRKEQDKIFGTGGSTYKENPDHPYWDFIEQFPGGEIPDEFKPESDPDVVGIFYGYDKDTKEGYLKTRSHNTTTVIPNTSSLAFQQNAAIKEVERRLLKLKEKAKQGYDVQWKDIDFWIFDLDNLVSSAGNNYVNSSIFDNSANYFSDRQKRDILQAAQLFWANEIIQPNQWRDDLEIDPIKFKTGEAVDTEFDPVFYKAELALYEPDQIFAESGNDLWEEALETGDWDTVFRFTPLPATQMIALMGSENPESQQLAAEMLAEGQTNYWKAHYRKYGYLNGIRGYKGDTPANVDNYNRNIAPTDYEYQMLRNLSLGADTSSLLESDPDFANSVISESLINKIISNPDSLTQILEDLNLPQIPEDEEIDFDQLKTMLSEAVVNLEENEKNIYLLEAGDDYREIEALKYLSPNEIKENKKFDLLFKDARNETIKQLETIRRRELEFDTLKNLGGLKEVFNLGEILADNLLGDGLGMVMAFGGDTSINDLKSNWADKFQDLSGISNNVTYNWQKWFDETLTTKYAEVEADRFIESIRSQAFANTLQEEQELAKQRLQGSTFINEYTGNISDEMLNKVNEKILETIETIEQERGDREGLLDEEDDVLFSQEFIDRLKENAILNTEENLSTYFSSTEGSVIKDYIDKQKTPFQSVNIEILSKLKNIGNSLIDYNKEYPYYTYGTTKRYWKEPNAIWRYNQDGVTKRPHQAIVDVSGFESANELINFLQQIIDQPYEIKLNTRKDILGIDSKDDWAKHLYKRNYRNLTSDQKKEVDKSWNSELQISNTDETLQQTAQTLLDVITGEKTLPSNVQDFDSMFGSLKLNKINSANTALIDYRNNPSLRTEEDLNNSNLLPLNFYKNINQEIEDEEGNTYVLNKSGYTDEEEQELFDIKSTFDGLYNTLYSQAKKGLKLKDSEGEEIKIEYDFANEFINTYLKPRFDYSKSMEEFVSYMDVEEGEENIFQTINRLEEVKIAAFESAKEQFQNIIEGKYDKDFNSNYYLNPYDHLYAPVNLNTEEEIKAWQENRQIENINQKNLIQEDLERAINDPTGLVDPDNPSLGTWVENLYYYGYINKLDDTTIENAINDLDTFARLHYQLIGSKGINVTDEDGNTRLVMLSASENPQNISATILRNTIADKAASIPTVFSEFVSPDDAIKYLLGGVNPEDNPEVWKDLLQSFGLGNDTTFEELSDYAAEVLRTAEAAEIRETIELLNKKELKPTQARLGATYIERDEDNTVNEEDFTAIYKLFQDTGYQGTQKEFFDTFLEGESLEDMQVLDKIIQGKIPEFEIDLSDPFTSLTSLENIFDDPIEEQEDITTDEDNLFDFKLDEDEEDQENDIESTLGNLGNLFTWK